MLGLKKVYKALSPPIIDLPLRLILKKIARKGGYFSGPYLNWDQAKEQATGYDADEIINKVRKSTLNQKQNNVFARDGVELAKADHSYPLVTALLALLYTKPEINIMDFGGGLGSTYYNCKPFITNKKCKVTWHIVEQPHFVQMGRIDHQTDELIFFNHIDHIHSVQADIDMILLSSVLQYLPNPLKFISDFKNKKYPYIFIDRLITHVLSSQATSMMIEHVPTHIYKASYPCYIFNYQELLNEFLDQYEIVYEFNANEGRQNLGNIDVVYKGVLLKLK